MKTKILVRSAVITLAVLLIPFIAMQLSTGVNWSISDFTIMGILVFSTVVALSFAIARQGNIAYRLGAMLAIATAFLLVWVNLAVGLIGSGPNFANLMYGGMLILGIAGAFLARFHATGMARSLFAMALAQMLVPVIALAIFQFERMPGEHFEDTSIVIGVTGFFTGLWLISALLFRRAAGTTAIEPHA